MIQAALFGYLMLANQALAIDVAVCDASSYTSDVTDKLAADPAIDSVADIDCGASTPTIDELRAYDAVLFYSDSTFSDTVALGNVLADYVDEGYGAVEAVFSVADNIKVEGRFLDEGYRAIDAESQSNDVFGELVAVDPDHPLLAGVTSFNGGSSGYQGDAAVAHPGATLVANWTDGDALVAEHVPSGAGTVVALNFYPPSSDIRDDFWDSSTDGVRLMVNALEFAAGGGGAGGGPTLTAVGGSCPGPWELDLSGLTPDGQYAMLFSRIGEGTDMIPMGPCAGMTTGLTGLRWAFTQNADGSGGASHMPEVPAGACGATIQVLDVATCTLTNTAIIGGAVDAGSCPGSNAIANPSFESGTDDWNVSGDGENLTDGDYAHGWWSMDLTHGSAYVESVISDVAVDSLDSATWQWKSWDTGAISWVDWDYSDGTTGGVLFSSGDFAPAGDWVTLDLMPHLEGGKSLTRVRIYGFSGGDATEDSVLMDDFQFCY